MANSITSRTIIAAVSTLAVLAFAPVAHATNGREAVRSCESNPKCTLTFGDDGVVIIIGDKIIFCPTAQGECTVSRKKRKSEVTGYGGGSNGKNQDNEQGNAGTETGGSSGGSDANTGSANMGNAGMTGGTGGGGGAIN